jgi:hypothetical protein
VYVAPIDSSEPPRALTSGRQGETHNPDFSHDGNFVAWLEMSEDGNDADKFVIFLIFSINIDEATSDYVSRFMTSALPSVIVWRKTGIDLLTASFGVPMTKCYTSPLTKVDVRKSSP